MNDRMVLVWLVETEFVFVPLAGLRFHMSAMTAFLMMILLPQPFEY